MQRRWRPASSRCSICRTSGTGSPGSGGGGDRFVSFSGDRTALRRPVRGPVARSPWRPGCSGHTHAAAGCLSGPRDRGLARPRPDPDRRPDGRGGLAEGRRLCGLPPARPRGGPAGDRGHRAASRLRRRRALRRRPALRPRSGAGRPAPVAPRRAGRRRPLHGLPRPAPRPAHGCPLRGERRRRAARRHHLQRHLDRPIVGRGLGVAGHARRAGLDGRDADPVLGAALPAGPVPDLGHQRRALHPEEERERLAGAGAQARERARLAHGRRSTASRTCGRRRRS